MSIFHNLQAVTIEVDVAIEIHFKESPHRNLILATILHAVSIPVEGEVMLNRTTRVFCFLVLAGCESGEEIPERGEDWNGGKDGEENGRLQAATDFPGKI